MSCCSGLSNNRIIEREHTHSTDFGKPSTSTHPSPNSAAMVVFNVKEEGDSAFLFETTNNTQNCHVIASLVAVHNGRIRARIVADAVRSLVSDGPMEEPPDASANAGTPSSEIRRCGQGPDPENSELLLRVAKELEDYIGASQAQRRVSLTEAGIDQRLDAVREAVGLAYRGGLPPWDATRVSLDSSITDLGRAFGVSGLLDSKATSLWVAGREFDRNKVVSDRLGMNEKTRVVAKLQASGDSQPLREPLVSEDERKAMLASYAKRQEELKRLAACDEDDCMNSPWADPKGMKRELQGLGDIKAPGLRF